MKLEAVKIARFRSIKEAKSISISDLTVLIGRNNEGKSNILHAINMAMTALEFYRSGVYAPRNSRNKIVPNTRRSEFARVVGYAWDRDFPVSLRASRKKTTTEVTLDFRLDDLEIQDFREISGSLIDGRLPIQISFMKDGGFEVAVKKQGPGTSRLNRRPERVASFVARRIRFEYIEAVRTAKRASEEINRLVRGILSDFNDEDVIYEALQKIEEMQAPFLKEVEEILTERLKKFIPGIKSASVKLNNDERFRALSQNVEIFVDDGEETSILRKGDGVQSLASLALASSPILGTRNKVSRCLAIEEPEAHLHPKAIRDLKKTIEELSGESQVIVSTHSPLFVNTTSLKSNVIVEGGVASPAAKIHDIRECLGVEPPDNLIGAEVAILVEGVCDVSFLQKYASKFHPGVKSRLASGQVVIVSCDGADKVSYMLKLYQTYAMRCLVLFDDDGAGRNAADQLCKADLLSGDVLYLCSIEGRRDTEIEDLVPEKIISDILVSCGMPADKPFLSSRSRFSKRLSELATRSGKRLNDDGIKKIKIDMSEKLDKSEPAMLDIKRIPSIDNLMRATRKM